MKERLSRVFLDGYPITLMGDEAVPPLWRIVRAGGKHPDRVDVLYLTSPNDLRGRPVSGEELIDRTVEPARPIYLRSVPRDVRPIYTVHDEPADPWTASDAPSSTPKGPMANADPVIAQLGRDPSPSTVAARPPHEEGVFRSPTSGALGAAAPRPANRVSGIEALAEAEAAAEQRQEDERNQEDALQDEQEELADADDDASARQ